MRHPNFWQQDPRATCAARSGFHSVHANVSPRSLQLIADVCRLEKKKKKTGRDQGEKKILLFSFLCLLFYLQYLKKENQISNFKIQNSKFENSKKICGIYSFYSFFMSRDRATELRSRAKTILRSKPLSH